MAGQLFATLVVLAVTATTNAHTTPAPNCPPMPDGICLAGRALDPQACGVWKDGTGARLSVDGRSDDQMQAAGHICEVACANIDAHHRKNADPHSWPHCSGIYEFYNGNTNCCMLNASAPSPAVDCPPMPHGICLAGRALDPQACGVWKDGIGARLSVDGRSDAQMYEEGHICEGACGAVDAHHRKNAEPHGGANCSGIYGFYNGNTNCCMTLVDCPPMPNGICLPGRALDPTACGVWEDVVTGGRQSVDKRSDAQMYAAGYFCKGVCGDVDAHHRKNAEPNGGPDCSGIYGFYNGDTNCCTKPAPRCVQISREKAARIKAITCPV